MSLLSESVLDDAAGCLKQGGLVAFPTETVYGLGCDAHNPEALKQLYTVKGRPKNHPVIVHLADQAMLSDWAIAIPDTAWRLAAAFWPGPLTLILKRQPNVLDAVTGGQDTIGLRIPAHPVALTLLQKFGGGIAAPSANRFGAVSPTTANHVRQDLGNAVDMILDGGVCPVGIESTIVDCTGKHPAILRPGMIHARRLAEVLGIPPAQLTPSLGAPRVSGSMPQHYAPQTPVWLARTPEALHAMQTQWVAKQQAYAVFSPSKPLEPIGDRCHWVCAPTDPAEYAAMLYQTLRNLDALNVSVILIAAVPETDPAWAGIADRLQRAAAGPPLFLEPEAV